MDPRRRSRIVLLTMAGLPLSAVALGSAMFPGQQMRRNLYADRAACERDYRPAQCAQGSGSATVGGWHGPYYFANRSAVGAQSDPGAGRAGQAIGSEISTRGGFGHFGHGMHAGG